MILTGDTLFLGDVGRPDLLASIGVTAEELAGMLYHSLNHKILALPDETLVYPAHGAGSMCGKQLSNAAVSTLGEQRKYNYALQPMSKQDFIEMVTTDLPEAPQYFVHDAIMNRKERQTLSETLSASWKAFSLDEVLEMLNTDTQVIDVRDATESPERTSKEVSILDWRDVMQPGPDPYLINMPPYWSLPKTKNVSKRQSCG